jgi:hypothetical protein
MRGYFFTNMYLSAIQKGIQTAHCATALFGNAFKHTADERTGSQEILVEYANEHMTKIVLDGGNSKMLQEVHDRLVAIAQSTYYHEIKSAVKNEKLFDLWLHDWYPFAKFHEDEQSLNGALTCVGLVLPESIYKFADDVRRGKYKVIDVTRSGSTYIEYEVRDTSKAYAVFGDGSFMSGQGMDALSELGLLNSDIALAQLITYARLAS